MKHPKCQTQMTDLQPVVNLFLIISFFFFPKKQNFFQLVFLNIEFSISDVLLHHITNAAKEGCSFLKDVVDLMDCLTQGDTLTQDEREIIMYHLDVARDTQFADVTEDSNGQEFETRSQPMVSLFSHYISQYTRIIS